MFNFRKMSMADVQAVVNIEDASSKNPWTEIIFQDCIKAQYECWVVEKAADLIGFIIFLIAAEDCHLLNIAIAPGHRECGHGLYLMQKMIEIAFSHRVKQIFLEVRVSNLIALHLYQSLGFIKTGIRKNYYKLKEGREDAILMTLSIQDKSA